MASRPPVFYEVPAATPVRSCSDRSCGASIYFVLTPKGARMPVDVDIEGGAAPTATEPGRGVSHYGTCPGAAHFSRRRSAP